MDLFVVGPAQWEIWEPGVLGLVGTDHTCITLSFESAYHYTVFYRDDPVAKFLTLGEAKQHAMTLPALLLDFGMEP